MMLEKSGGVWLLVEGDKKITVNQNTGRVRLIERDMLGGERVVIDTKVPQRCFKCGTEMKCPKCEK